MSPAALAQPFDDPWWDVSRTLAGFRRVGVLEAVVTAAMFARIHKLLCARAIYVDMPGMTSAFRCVVDGQEITICTRDPEP